jgi:branched-chain amino acid transport system permease protein
VLTTGITTGVMFGLVAVGFTIVFNSSDVINFAQGEFVIGGGMAYILVYRHTHVIILAALVAVLIGAALGSATYQGLIRPARRASVMSILILTLGVSVFLQGVMLVLAGPNPQSAPPFTAGGSIGILGAQVTPQALWIVGLLVIISVLLTLFFERTTLGLQMIACAIDRRGAQLMGINVGRMVLLSWIVSSALAALAGVMLSPLISVTYNGGLAIAINGFAAAVLSGMGRVGGALAGGLIVGIVNALAAAYLPQNLLAFQDVTGVVLLILVLMVRPSGLFGGRAEARHTVTLAR